MLPPIELRCITPRWSRQRDRVYREGRAADQCQTLIWPSGADDQSHRHGRSARIITHTVALTPGTRLGVYEVIAKIGQGGMGQVWRARHTKLNRDVALKVLPDVFANDAPNLRTIAPGTK